MLNEIYHVKQSTSNYCPQEHQASHRPQHESACNKIWAARAELDEEEDLVRYATEDDTTPANAFETHVGDFWNTFSTRDYMLARFALSNHLFLIGTLDGACEALEHMQDLIRLCRRDDRGARDKVPALMLRLDLDQECYDFVKWWETYNADGPYDWDDMTAPHLNIHGADVFEDPNFFGRSSALNNIIAILLLKLKLLVDIRNLKVTRKVLALRCLPHDLWQPIELSVIRSPLSVKLQKESPQSLLEIEKKLLNQTCKIGATLVKVNRYFMHSLFDPDDSFFKRLSFNWMGSWEKMALAMQNSYATWWETEGALDLLYDARECAARDYEDGIEELAEAEEERSGGRTVEEIKEDVGVRLIWEYLGWAVENASYLGPWSERPSEQHTRANKEAWAQGMEEEAEFDGWLDEGLRVTKIISITLGKSRLSLW
ncbi:hypothetical protein CEP54_006569 [Fusarium duplospermum]|uniref:Uncharacterized protein n=1 Tax=Fusarium duplospermum TaxID=1325734 RepID=A0A428Q686_9HYPO|nr:hypothetical protein CEP54_006569 [Fusarium duplospermum]